MAPRQTTIIESDIPGALQQQALLDALERTRGGRIIHLPLWILLGWIFGLVKTHPILFWSNLVLFLSTFFPRLFLTSRAVSSSSNEVQIASSTRLFIILYICTGIQWGLLTATAVSQADLEGLRVPLWLVVTGICASGTSSLAFFRAVRIYYPIALLAPTMVVLLLWPSRLNAFVLGASILFMMYIINASKTLYSDYWSAALSQWELEKQSLRFEQLSKIDPLTQLSNRRCFDERLDAEWARASRGSQALSVMMIDVDHFKRVNDTYGHDAGDRCLQTLAEVLQSGLHRPSDLIARYGGEEFAVLLPSTESEGAMIVAERLRRSVCDIELREGNHRIPLSCSIGVYTIVPQSDHLPAMAMKCADQAVYQAKQSGRNCVVPFL